MSYSVVLARSAQKEIGRLDKAIQRRVLSAAQALADNPRPHGCRKMVGYSHRWRIRIGDYRIVYDIDDAIVTVHVIKVGHRGDIYR